MIKITGASVVDLRYPTSKQLDGSDAMNPDPDYSAAYLRLHTSAADLTGHGFAFSIGRGNDLQVAAIESLADRLVGRDVDGLCEDPAALNRELLWDSQLRWFGPDKGVIHMAMGVVMTAVWDLRCRREQRPLWAALLALTPAEVVAMVDWTYIADFLDPGRARERLEQRLLDRPQRLARMETEGIAAYTTTPGWLGYTDEKLVRLCREAVTDGFATIKLKVGADIDEDRRRLALAREAVGPDINIAVDANQFWSVSEAITAINQLREFDLRWVEEPTHPDDMVGHGEIARAVDPVPIATGEMLANPVMARQLLQLGGVQVLQIDATRMAGVHDLLAVMLLADHAGVDVIPHAGGVGLCEAVQHYAYFYTVALASDPSRVEIEYVDHLHDQLQVPVRLSNGRYFPPSEPGAGTAFTSAAISDFAYPAGTEWME